jgi:hypothetical protein
MIVNRGRTTVVDRRDTAIAHLAHLSTWTAYQIQFLKDNYESENEREFTKCAALFGGLSNTFIKNSIYNLFCLQ